MIPPLLSEITVRGAALHNLKHVSFSLPRNQLVIFTGLSGSGKSMMAFDSHKYLYCGFTQHLFRNQKKWIGNEFERLG